MVTKKPTSPLPPPSARVEKNLMSFPDAIKAVIEKKRIARREWNKGNEEYGVLKDDFLMIYREGKFHRWLVSEGDMLAIDWIVLGNR